MTEHPADLLGRNRPLLLVSNLNIGGSEGQAVLLARALVQLGIRPGVLLWNVTGEDVHLGEMERLSVPVVTAPQSFGRWQKLGWMRSIVAATHPPILHSMAFYLNFAAALAMVRLPGRAVGSIRADYKFEADSGYAHYRLNRCWPETIIANSMRAYQAARLDRSLFRPRRVLFVPNALDLELYAPRNHAPLGSVQILGVGNLYPSKRWDRAIRVIAAIASGHPTLQFHLKIAGDGCEMPSLKALAETLGVSSRVSFLGRRRDIPNLLASADVFVLLSDSEGTSNAVMEAMAAGLPVLCTGCGDASRLIQTGVHGFVMNSEDEPKIAERLLELITDADLRARLGANGRQRALAQFGLDRLGDAALRAYEQAGWKQAQRLRHACIV